jgi:hypothetical protein
VLISGAIGRRVTERAPLSRSGGHPHSFLENTYLLESEAYAPIEQLILNQWPNGLRTYTSNVSDNAIGIRSEHGEGQSDSGQKRTESGLSEGQFEFKSFTVIVAGNRTGSRRKTAGLRADWEDKT